MSADTFAAWLGRQGHKILRTESSYWSSHGPGAYQALPYQWLVAPGHGELQELFLEHKALAVRYSTDLDARAGSLSYHVVLEKQPYSLQSIGKKARHDVRRGLSAGRMEPVPFPQLAEQGWLLRSDTLTRQGRSQAESHPWWRRLCLSAEGLPGIEAWAFLAGEEMAAALISITVEDTCLVLYHQSRTKYLDVGVNNALCFEFTRMIFERPEIQQIFYGLHSLDAPPSVDEFKFRMGYIARPVRQVVAFHPWLAPLANPLSHSALRLMLRLRPGQPTLSKAEGMLRFYLQGRLPLEQQPLPPALQGQNPT